MRFLIVGLLAIVGCLVMVPETESACLFSGIRGRIAARRAMRFGACSQVTTTRQVTVIRQTPTPMQPVPVEKKMPKK